MAGTVIEVTPHSYEPRPHDVICNLPNLENIYEIYPKIKKEFTKNPFWKSMLPNQLKKLFNSIEMAIIKHRRAEGERNLVRAELKLTGNNDTASDMTQCAGMEKLKRAETKHREARLKEKNLFYSFVDRFNSWVEQVKTKMEKTPEKLSPELRKAVVEKKFESEVEYITYYLGRVYYRGG